MTQSINPLKTSTACGHTEPPASPSLRRCLLPGLLVLFILASTAIAANAIRGSGSLTGHAAFTPLDHDLVGVDFDCSGNFTFLGKSRMRLHLVADFSGPVPGPVPPSLGVLTAANGDTLSFKLQWAVQQVLGPGIFQTGGPFEIISGTGRFVNVSGGGTYQSVVNMSTGEASSEITGELALH